MAIINTPKHLKYSKTKLKQLKAGSHTEGLAFCILRRKGAQDAVVHFDKPARVGQYKNPAAIHKVLKKTTAFDLDDANPFFNDISKLVSLTGVVTHTDGKLHFQKTLGRGKEADLKLGMKFLKQAKFSFGTTAPGREEVVAATSRSTERITALKTLSPDDWATVASDPGAHFGTVEGLGDIIEQLTESGEDPVLLQKLKAAYTSIDDWSEDGIEPVDDAMALLSGITDFREEETDIQDAWQMGTADMRIELSKLRTKAAEMLTQKSFGGQFKSLFSQARTMSTMRMGHYQFVHKTIEAVGGGPLLMVSASSTFQHQILFDDVKAVPIAAGRFRRSKSGKKIAFQVNNGSTTEHLLQSALKKSGLASSTAFIVDDFDDFQATMKAKRQVNDLKSPAAIATLTLSFTLEKPLLRDLFAEHCADEYSAENIAYYLQEEGLPIPSCIPADLVIIDAVVRHQAFISKGLSTSLNLPHTVYETAVEQDPVTAYSTVKIEVITLFRDTFARFVKGKHLSNAVGTSAEIRTLIGIR
ncbi:MAG: hypothetical protein ACI8RZ_000031 [Myxococcota bacterium]